MSVSSLISEAQGRTTDLTASAQGALDAAISAVENMGYTITTFSGATLPPAPPGSANLTAPILPNVNLNLPPEPGAAPAYQDISAIVPGTVPTLEAMTPEITLPTNPSQLA